MLKKPFTKDQLLLKVDQLHDQIWDIIERQKLIALKEKDEIISSCWTEKEIEKICGIFLRIVVCELNRIHWLRYFLAYYFSWKLEKHENEFTYECSEFNINQEELPHLNPKEIVPYSRILYIMGYMERFFDENYENLQRHNEIPEEMKECMYDEIKKSNERIFRIKN